MLWTRVGLVKAIREPLVHFVVIGAAISGLYGLMRDAPDDAAADRIVVTTGDIERLGSLWHKQRQRPPTAEELRGLIAGHIREEVLYREALALGLDRDDTIVRRRLAQKFEFLTEDLAAAREPTAAELVAFFDANRNRYLVPPRLSFTQLYFNPDRRGAGVEGDAGVALASLRGESPETSAVELGDSFMLDERYEQRTPQEIEGIFGREFAEAVSRLDSGVWSGPVTSGYGLHLVRIDERIESRLPALAEVAAEVRNDWAYDQRRQANDAIYQRLLSRYSVVIEDTPYAAAVAPPGADQGAGQ